MPEFTGTLKQPRSSAPPSSPVPGQQYYDTDDNLLYFWNGTAWIAGGGAAVDVFEQATDPGAAAGVGDFWIETDVTLPPYQDLPNPAGKDGQWLKATSGVAIWAVPEFKPGYGTSLPGSPVDGQEYVLVDNLTNPNWQWRFRYNASSAWADKWEFVGGSPVVVEVATTQSPTAFNAWQDLATVGPSFIVPRSGVYIHRVQATYSCTAGDWSKGHMGVALGAGSPGGNQHSAVNVHGAAGIGATDSWESSHTVWTIGQEMRARYYSMNTNNNAGLTLAHCSYTIRRLRVTPVRVS